VTIALTGDRLLGRAFLVSLVLHLMVFALIPPLVASQGPGVETLSFVRIIQITAPQPTPHPARLVAATAPVAAPVTHASAQKPATHKHSAHPAVAEPASPLPRATIVAAAVRPGDAAQTVSASAPPVVAPTASAQPPSSESPPNHEQAVGGVMPLGVDEPSPVLESSAREALGALGVHVTLTVDVDAHGHVLSVAFAPPIDPAIEEKIRTMLASASWDPAVCGAGIACEGSAVIKL
jgi:hypothetical protein